MGNRSIFYPNVGIGKSCHDRGIAIRRVFHPDRGVTVRCISSSDSSVAVCRIPSPDGGITVRRIVGFNSSVAVRGISSFDGSITVRGAVGVDRSSGPGCVVILHAPEFLLIQAPRLLSHGDPSIDVGRGKFADVRVMMQVLPEYRLTVLSVLDRLQDMRMPELIHI